jgi:dihydrofolate reductase
MRRLLMWNVYTLDGLFEGAKPWDLEFHNTAWGDELQRFSLEQTAEVGTVLYGRATYQGMASYWSTAKGETADFMNRVPKVVFSNTLESAAWSNTRLVKGDAVAEVKRLKQEEGKDLFVMGSAKLCGSLMEARLIDEYRLCLAPIVLGEGTPLFKPHKRQHRLRLLESRPLQTGGIILRYAPHQDD